MTVVVNLRSEEEASTIKLTKERENEILRRDQAFIEGKTSARSWGEIKKDLEDACD